MSLAAELALRVGRIQAAPQQFQCHLLAHAIDRAHRAEHGRGTAFTEHLDQLERTDPRTRGQRLCRLGIAEYLCQRCRRHVRQRIGRPCAGFQHALHECTTCGLGAMRIEEMGALRDRQLDHGLEQLAQRRVLQ
ncbi:MAG: hypothetical protein ACHP7D_03115 [Lysobacterales bacterium]